VRGIATAVLLAAFLLTARAAGTLEIFFIDDEGGESTLIVSPTGQSLLIDAGYAGRGSTRGRDAERIAAVVREARLERLDYLLVTHSHPDHVGGVPELATRLPIGTFIDMGEPLGTDRMAGRGFRNYEPIRSAGRHIVVQAGDRLPLSDPKATVVSAGGLGLIVAGLGLCASVVMLPVGVLVGLTGIGLAAYGAVDDLPIED
jgi:glyoxylase-like metal-dependent hydrolase (beta-lactamase superfamily II)